ncbi:MAG: response regulator transcription factor [Chloroflexota bacterium]
MQYYPHVVLVDDGAPSLAPLRVALTQTTELVVIEQIDHRSSLISLIESTQPDIIIMGFQRVPVSIIWQLVHIHSHTTNVLSLACLADPISDDVWGLLTVGVHGYLHIDDIPQGLLSGIEHIQRGGMWWSPSLVPLLQEWSSAQTGPHTLLPDPYELAIVNLIAQGQTNRQIARELSISERAIRFHLGQLYTRWGVQNRTQAVLFAKDHGWLDEDIENNSDRYHTY